MKPGTVYLITNKENGMRYVGATSTSLEKRWHGHVCLSKRTKSVLGAAIVAYGRDAFTIEPLAICYGREELAETERLLTAALKTFEPHGYNRKLGHKHSDGTKEAMLGRVPWQKGKPSAMKGVPRTKKTRKKISAALKGRTPSAEAIANMAAAKTGAIILKKRKQVIDQHGTVYRSVQECADAIGVKISAVSAAVHKRRPHAKGFILDLVE